MDSGHSALSAIVLLANILYCILCPRQATRNHSALLQIGQQVQYLSMLNLHPFDNEDGFYLDKPWCRIAKKDEKLAIQSASASNLRFSYKK